MSILEIDELRRNPDDGAYHCPQCDAPFTRRSNLRRHYAIHIRNMTTKCQACRMTFSSSEELQYHTLQCPRNVWNTQSDPTPTPLENHFNNAEPGPSFTTDQPSTISPDFFSLAPPAHTQQEQMDDFFSSFISASIPPSPLSFTPIDSAPSSGLATPDWGLTPLPPTGAKLHTGCVSDSLSLQGFRPRISWTSTLNELGIGRRGRSKEKPIYTRRQVEDMLDIMSRTFEERMEEIVRRSSYSNPRDFGAPTEGSAAPGAPSVHPYDL